LNNWDIALPKDDDQREINAEFRAELFNAFNHAQFLSPDGNVNSASFGLVTNESAANHAAVAQAAVLISRTFSWLSLGERGWLND
jgi:hypothetical protein